MALNEIYKPGWHLSVAATNPTTPASGDPVRFGQLTGVAMTDKGKSGNPSTLTSIYFGPGVFTFSVKGVDDNGNSAVAAGDSIFYVDGDTPKLSKKATGYFFGFAIGAVNSGSTGTGVQVLHVPSPGSGSLTSGGVNTTQLAAGAVTAPKLSTNLAIGYVPLPLTSWRLTATNDIAAKNAADGGLISLDTDPTLKRVNGATDKQLRIAWAATSVVEITTQFSYPPDLDDASTLAVNLLMGMGGAMDTPVVAVSYWEGVGDTNAGGNTASLAAAVANVPVTIAAVDVGAYPNVATIGLIPAAHANDAIYLYGAWISYARKS